MLDIPCTGGEMPKGEGRRGRAEEERPKGRMYCVVFNDIRAL